MAFGFFILFCAGLCQGSFGLGYKKYTPFSWSVFWGVYDIMCIITSVLFTIVLAPRFLSVFIDAGILCFVIPILCGAMWGLSAIGFSKGIDKIGMSLVYGISMGISTIVGSLMPMLAEKSYPVGMSAWMFAIGLILTILGVAVITYAGIKRDGGAKSSVWGIVLAVFSGVGSGFMNVGFTNMEGVTSSLKDLGYSQLAVSAVKWLPVLVGGCIAGVIYCIFETTVKKQWKTLTEQGSGLRAVKLFAVSIIWYLALILYGYSAQLLGEMGDTVGWILFNALALIISTLWGLKTGEWKGTKKTTLAIGCGVLIIAWVFTALV